MADHGKVSDETPKPCRAASCKIIQETKISQPRKNQMLPGIAVIDMNWTY